MHKAFHRDHAKMNSALSCTAWLRIHVIAMHVWVYCTYSDDASSLRPGTFTIPIYSCDPTAIHFLIVIHFSFEPKYNQLVSEMQCGSICQLRKHMYVAMLMLMMLWWWYAHARFSHLCHLPDSSWCTICDSFCTVPCGPLLDTLYIYTADVSCILF